MHCHRAQVQTGLIQDNYGLMYSGISKLSEQVQYYGKYRKNTGATRHTIIFMFFFGNKYIPILMITILMYMYVLWLCTHPKKTN